ncbi:sensor histidine kinase [Zafaria sp. Z1313]|uniref:sensor histidine kinase n=1 Tax=unclassified Zafaria TaxID=2828765 RepID=UPI002E79364E|nr:histidine kinase [Zafaria sp. J156]MEE1620923.1 histidine kinase [Zafaria sp. J156]
MRRLDTEMWAGIAMLVVSVAVAGPVLFGVVDATLPRPWWIAALVLFFAGLMTAFAGTRAVLRHAGFGAAVVCSWIVVGTTAASGLLPVLLVVTAASSVYLMPLAAGAGIVLANTAFLALVYWPVAGSTAEAAISVGFYLLIQSASMLSSATLLKEQRMRRELTEAHVELRAASVLLAESARTTERLRISRELHDLIGHQLTVLALELETATHLDGPRSREHVERANGVARALLRDVRGTVGQLRGEPPDLAAALREVVRELPGLEVSLHVEDGIGAGEAEAGALVRAVQEIVTNTLRHAGATTLRMSVATGPDGALVLSARDNGRGAVEPVPGNGLSGLRERFESLGGGLAVDGRDGFSVTARVPAP